MSINVLMENENHSAVMERVREFDPDLLFLMETDANWINDLEPILEGFDHVIRHPKDNHYGLVFASKIPVRKSRIEYLTVSETPTAFAELEIEDGTAFRFVGLHPRSPMPGVDTDQRDDQLLYAARFARKSGMPVFIMGDFNAVAWSDFSIEFKQFGQSLDPRIGRGPVPSFDVNSWLMRFPIDQIYVTPDVAVVDFVRVSQSARITFLSSPKCVLTLISQKRIIVSWNHSPKIKKLTIEKRMKRHQKRLDEVDR